MLLFGHIGITSGLVMVGQRVVDIKPAPGACSAQGSKQASSLDRETTRDRLATAMRSIDYRMVLLGSMLPDIIDKPAWLIFRGGLGWAGRGYAHTFLFSFILFAGGVFLKLNRDKTWLLTIAGCSFIHLVFDLMWLSPTTLWFPLMGPILPGTPEGWFSHLWQGLLHSPYVFVSETMGLAITAYTAVRSLVSKRVTHFVKTGDIQ